MKKLFKPSLLALWLSLFCMVALASCKTNNFTLRELHERYGLVYEY